MRVVARALLPLLAAACTAGERPATEVLVEVQIDPALAESIVRVHAEVHSVTSERLFDRGEYELTRGVPERGKVRAPFTFSVVKTKSERFLLAVYGFERDRAEPVVEQKVIARFEPHKTLLLPVQLRSVCYLTACSDLRQTCRGDGMTAGECVSVREETQLTPVQAGDGSSAASLDAAVTSGEPTIPVRQAQPAPVGALDAAALANEAGTSMVPREAGSSGATAGCDGGPACAPRPTCMPGQRVMSSGGTTSCVECGAGTFSAQPNADTCTPWTVCGAGLQEGEPGARSKDRTCVALPWTRQFGTSDDDSVDYLAVDRVGNVYVATGTSNSGYTLRKLDTTGRESWLRQLPSSTFGYVRGLALNSRDELYLLTIAFEGPNPPLIRKYNADGIELSNFAAVRESEHFSIDGSDSFYLVGRGEQAPPGQEPSGTSDVFVHRLSAAGSTTWTQQFGTSLNEQLDGIVADASGNAYVRGSSTGSFSVGLGLTFDPFVAKYNAAGQQQWIRRYGTPDDFDTVSAGAVDESGNLFVGGNWPASFPGQAALGNGDAYVRKYDSAGNELWTRLFGTSASDYVFRAALVGKTDVAVVGATSGTLPGQTSAGAMDVLVRRYSAAGADTWTLQVGTSGADWGRCIGADTRGNLYIGGGTNGAFSGQTNAGKQDGFLMKVVPPSAAIQPVSAQPEWP